MKVEYCSGNSQQLCTFYDNSPVTTIHHSQLFVTSSRYQSLPLTIHQSLGNGEQGMTSGEWGMTSGGMGNGEWEYVPDSLPPKLAGNGEWRPPYFGSGNGEWQMVNGKLVLGMCE